MKSPLIPPKYARKSMSRSESSTGSLKSAVKGLVMLAVLGLAVYLARRYGVGDMLDDAQWFNDQVLGHGPLSVAVFVAVGAVFTALGLPRQVIGFLGGFAFGVIWGTVLATVGSGLGCWLASAYARFAARDFVAGRLGGRVAKLDGFLRQEPFTMALAIRLFPLGSNLITNLAAGVSSIPLVPFVVGSTLGYAPQNFIFALFGAGLNAQSNTGLAVSVVMSVVLFLVSGWLGMKLYKKYRVAAKGAIGD